MGLRTETYRCLLYVRCFCWWPATAASRTQHTSGENIRRGKKATGQKDWKRKKNGKLSYDGVIVAAHALTILYPTKRMSERAPP